MYQYIVTYEGKSSYTMMYIGATAQCCAAYGQGTGSIWLDQVGCTGTEASLFNCPTNPIGSHDCSHGEDVGITCACKIESRACM